MNNLTPLQTLTAQIYCARIIAYVQLERVPNLALLVNNCIEEAETILKETKEPLEWMKAEVKNYINPAYYSNGYEFEIAQTSGGNFTVCSTKNLDNSLGKFTTFDEAKNFAEHIRTK
jgi:hypothetical protein